MLDEAGDVAREIPLVGDRMVIGRAQADVQFADDVSLAAEHAIISRRTDGVHIRDIAEGHGGATWIFLREPQVLADGDLILLGSQVIRYRRVPSLNAPARSTQAGSRVPDEDVGILEQVMSDGRVRDVCHVPRGKAILIGREHGNWVFPYDPTMSARHAEIRAHAEHGEVVVRDLGSRNGVGIVLRAERALHDGDRLLLGRQLLRVDLQ
ncbi:MAG: FHA domain-containing protein [Gemmatimonadaceae bacterium]